MSGRVLVTGCSGFVGTRLCAHLDSQGYEVFGCDIVIPQPAPNRRICDLAQEESVSQAVQWAAPFDAILHLAAITFVPEATKNPDRVVDINFQGTVRMIEAVQAHAAEARFVFVSSSEVYGVPQSLPVTEAHALAPENPYAITKASADQHCRLCFEASEMNVVRMRPFNHSGPGQSSDFVLSSFARQIAEIESGKRDPILRVGNLDAARDFSHVDDIIRAYEGVLSGAEAGEAYNICSGQSYRIADALDLLIGMSSATVSAEVDPEKLRDIDVPEIRGSHEKLTAATGWKPELPFERILDDLLAYWRSNV